MFFPFTLVCAAVRDECAEDGQRDSERGLDGMDAGLELKELNTKKAYLSQMRELQERIAFGKKRAWDLRRDAEALSAVWGERVSAHLQDAPYVRKLEEYEEENRKVEKDVLLLVRFREQMEKYFGALPDHRMRWIMEYRWMDGKSMVRIAELLLMSRTVVFEKYNMALERLILPEHPVDISREGRNADNPRCGNN